MVNARDLLGQLLQAGLAPSANTRIENALGEKGIGGPGSILDQLTQQVGQGRAEAANPLDRLGQMARQATSDPMAAVKGGNPVAVGGLGALVGALLGGTSGAVKGGVGAGLGAILAGLAREALSPQEGTAQGRQEGAPQAKQAVSDVPLGLRDSRSEAEEVELQSRSEVILKAMINAAKADGRIDKGEVERILEKVSGLGAGGDARAFLIGELNRPMDMEGIIRAVPDRETAAQVYTASVLATEADTPAERDYLQELASRLQLNAATVQYIHRALGLSGERPRAA